MKILYRDYIAMLITIMIPAFMTPEITIFDIKFYGIGGLIILLWYLGATRTTSNTGSGNGGSKCQ